MSNKVTADNILDIARAWLGYGEANGKFREILTVYNSHKPLARGYAIKVTDEWCDAFVSAVAIKAGAVDLIGTEVGCEKHVAIFKSKGIWIEDGAVKPEPGWIILFNWDKFGQPNEGNADHIGYVEKVEKGRIITIEGNKSTVVSRRDIPIGWGYIRGYARPNYFVESVEREDDDIMDFDKLSNEQVDALLKRIDERLSNKPVSEYAKMSSIKGVKSGLFADGDKDGMIDDPQCFLRRQELAVVLNRAGLLEKDYTLDD